MNESWRSWAFGLLMLSLTALPAQAVDCTGVPAWVATTLYHVGDRVTYQGGLHQSLANLANVPPTYCEDQCGWWHFVGLRRSRYDTSQRAHRSHVTLEDEQ